MKNFLSWLPWVLLLVAIAALWLNFEAGRDKTSLEVYRKWQQENFLPPEIGPIVDFKFRKRGLKEKFRG